MYWHLLLELHNKGDSNILKFINVVIFCLVSFASIKYGGKVSFTIFDKIVDVHICVIVFFIGAFFYIKHKIIYAFNTMFYRKSKHEKGIELIQKAFSSLLLKDTRETEVYAQRAKKYLGEIPLISWIEGQLYLMHNDEHKAKAIFYNLCSREKETVFGAYSLSKIAMQGKSDSDALNAIKAILAVSPNAKDLLLYAIGICIRNKNFDEAKIHVSQLTKLQRKEKVTAIVWSESGIVSGNIDDVKKAYKLAPELIKNTMHYANYFIQDQDFKTARSILMKSLQAFPNDIIFNEYINCENNLSNIDKIKLTEKVINLCSDSWIGYFYLAKYAAKENMMMLAFQNIHKAYEKKPYDFIVTELIKIISQLSDPKPALAIELLSKSLYSKSVLFRWKCRHCGAEENSWFPVCNVCSRVGEFTFIDDVVHESENIKINDYRL